ncbi:hypothetical protein NITHO_5610002 [Nitrolancea hollandica Lb]|uniref:Uncharacterized protein n=1 Tax=Nitrolancea hollandica Lb TaxID=1129897 RepID=I4EM44_9BACT|nr:hypothetical protein NITHO_5610002 [Nitrolancea hollandica Lb]
MRTGFRLSTGCNRSITGWFWVESGPAGTLTVNCIDIQIAVILCQKLQLSIGFQAPILTQTCYHRLAVGVAATASPSAA